MKKILTVLLILLLLVTVTACGKSDPAPAAQKAPGIQRDKHFITVLTGPTSGVYFPIGGGFSKFIGSMGYKTSATATGASAENINSLLNGQGELAIAMSDAVIQAVEGFGAYGGASKLAKAGDLRAMMGLWPNYVQIVAKADSGINSVKDLAGKRVGVGAPNSGVELNARMIFEAYGMSYKDCARVDYLNYGEAIGQMKNNQMDAVFVTSGLGNATIKELAVTDRIKLVPVEGEGLKNLLAKYPFYAETVIPKDAYGTEKDTTTAAVINIMLVAKSLPDEVVYDLLNGFYSDKGLETIGASHATAKAEIKLSTALRGIKGTSVPLHPGAIKWYTEKGIAVK